MDTDVPRRGDSPKNLKRSLDTIGDEFIVYDIMIIMCNGIADLWCCISSIVCADVRWMLTATILPTNFHPGERALSDSLCGAIAFFVCTVHDLAVWRHSPQPWTFLDYILECFINEKTF